MLAFLCRYHGSSGFGFFFDSSLMFALVVPKAAVLAQYLGIPVDGILDVGPGGWHS